MATVFLQQIMNDDRVDVAVCVLLLSEQRAYRLTAGHDGVHAFL